MFCRKCENETGKQMEKHKTGSTDAYSITTDWGFKGGRDFTLKLKYMNSTMCIDATNKLPICC